MEVIVALVILLLLLVAAARGLDRWKLRRELLDLRSSPVERGVFADARLGGTAFRVLFFCRVRGLADRTLDDAWTRLPVGRDPVGRLLDELLADAVLRCPDAETDADLIAVARTRLEEAGLAVLECRVAGRVELDARARRLRQWDVMDCVTSDSGWSRSCNALDFYLDGLSGLGRFSDVDGPTVRSIDAVRDPSQEVMVTQGGDPVRRTLRQLMDDG